MSNTLEYIVKLQDQMSATMQKVASVTSNTNLRVRELDSSLKSLNKADMSGFYSTLRNAAAAYGVGEFIGKTITMGMEQEMRNMTFEVLFGGVDKAKEMIDQISLYAKESPYGKEELSDAAAMMAGFGIAQDKIMPNMRMLGDIAMGNKEKFKSLALTLSQVQSIGYLQAENKNQFINGGNFNPLTELEKMTGKSSATLTKMMSDGKISFQMVESAMKHATSAGGLFHGMIGKINETVSGQWAMAMDSVNEKLISIYTNVLQPLLLPALKRLNKFLDDPIGTIERLVNRFTTDFPILTGIILTTAAAFLAYKLTVLGMAGLNLIVAGWKMVLVGYEIVVFAVRNATSLWAAAQWLLNVAMNLNPVGLVVSLIIGLIAIIAYLVYKIDGWKETWRGLVQYHKYAMEMLGAYIKMKWLDIINDFYNGYDKIRRGWYGIKSLWDKDGAKAGLDALEYDRKQREDEILIEKNKAVAAAKNMVNTKVWHLRWNNNNLTDIFGGVKDKFNSILGITAPTVPGMGDGTVPVTGDGTGDGTGKDKDKNKDKNKDKAREVSTGGQKTTHITINISEMGNGLKVYVNDLREGADKIQEVVTDALTRSLSMAQGLGTN